MNDRHHDPIWWDYELRIESEPSTTYALGRYAQPQERVQVHVPLLTGARFEIHARPIYEFEIWREGFAATGERGLGQYLGRAVGTSFEQACSEFFRYHEALGQSYRQDNNTWYGCRLFASEKEARESFG